MTSARDHDIIWPYGVKPPPRGRDLPYDDGEPMETPNHRWQMNLLCEVFEHAARANGHENAFVGGNMAFCYSSLQINRNDFESPDVFVVLDAIDNPDRPSWVLWEEDQRTPNVVVELLSPTTEKNDRGPKFRVYEQLLKVDNYFLYDPMDHRFEGWQLGAQGYEALIPDADGRLDCRAVGRKLGRWQGTFSGRTNNWLRLFDADGRLTRTYTEAAVAQANAETERANAAEAELAALRAELAKRGAT